MAGMLARLTTGPAVTFTSISNPVVTAPRKTKGNSLNHPQPAKPTSTTCMGITISQTTLMSTNKTANSKRLLQIKDTWRGKKLRPYPLRGWKKKT